MLLVLLIPYAFSVALVTSATLLFRAALGDKRRPVAALAAPLAIEAAIAVLVGIDSMTLLGAGKLYLALLPGGVIGACLRVE